MKKLSHIYNIDIIMEESVTEIRQETREINHALKQELQEEHRELKESTEPRKK